MIIDEFKYLTVFYIAIFFLIILIGTIRSVKLTKVYYYLSMIFIVCVSYWAFCLVPTRGLDLFRLQQSVDWVSLNCNNLFDAVIKPEDKYTGLLGLNILFYIVSRMGSSQWLQTIGVFSTFTILIIMLLDFARSKNYNSKAIIPAFAIVFMGMPIQYVFSGVRNAMAVSLVILSLYLLLYKKIKYKWISYILFLIGATIHPAVLMILPALAISFSKKQLVYRLLALLGIPIIFGTASLLQSLPNTFIQYIVNRVVFYQNVQYQYDRPEMIANIVVFILIGSGNWYFKKEGILDEDNESKTQKIYENIYYFMGFLMIGCSIHRDFTLRVGYMMGILGVPMLLKIIFKMNKYKSSTVKFTELVMFVGILICEAKVYYDTYFVMSQFVFD